KHSFNGAPVAGGVTSPDKYSMLTRRYANVPDSKFGRCVKVAVLGGHRYRYRPCTPGRKVDIRLGGRDVLSWLARRSVRYLCPQAIYPEPGALLPGNCQRVGYRAHTGQVR